MKVCIIGGTGLVGKEAVKQLIVEHTVTSFVRRPSGLADTRLHEVIVNFNNIDEWKHLINGDVLISALGTTIKAAGSKEAQYLVDHDYQLKVATAASENGVKTYVLISSVNADPKSAFFYLRMKGELEEKIKNLKFSSINILRPGPLKGHRENPRLGEVVSTSILGLLPTFLVTAGMRPVEGRKVAQVAVKAGLESASGVQIIGPEKIV